MTSHALRFQFNEKKGVETLTYIASAWPDITAFFASKVLFFAEKRHLNRYARPIVAGTFIGMPAGPVPSTLYDFIKGQYYSAEDPEAISQAFQVAPHPWQVRAKRDPDLSVLAPSDIECLDEAISFCQGKPFGYLSNLTHQERAWAEAPLNGPMEYEAMIDDDHPKREQLLEEAREFAAYGVL